MEHRLRYCPKPAPRCLVPLPVGYKTPVPWPRSRDMIWYNNVPHPKLIEYKKDQNWVRKSGDYLVFPGGGTQFKEGVTSYIQFIEKILPSIEWGKHTRVVLDVGCGVASFGGYLLDKSVLTMSFAPKDEHEAQIQFALERGIPAFLAVIGTQKLTFPDNVFDMIHCARCRVHWDADGGMPLLELNRILRPGGFFIWSATPVYRSDSRDQNVWNAMVALTEAFCWKVVAKETDAAGIGVVIYQKPVSNSCYEGRKADNPPICLQNRSHEISWYSPLGYCLPRIPVPQSGQESNWPISWPERLTNRPPSSQDGSNSISSENFLNDMTQWDMLVSKIYLHDLGIDWLKVRNVMDMNAGFGGFAAALINQPLWVMNVVPIHGPDTLPIIFDRGLIGVYHDWCEAFNTYPRTYDLLHSSFLFGGLAQRCDLVEVAMEMDRILRPGGWVLVQDTIEMLQKIQPILISLHWETTLHNQKFLVCKKGLWRPAN
ncbi:probable methyltransferase PMT23 isoform X1 [Dioscorea cayenensis subsp. rotundata]|uniref:Methyltransferase n=1 Tax=Dioscorea cayennensis subsp. rotundata TaxID=55577 RepID=A0AB40C075_DIOCR|nr:probable methyltransferase PMT23 isoform X1 [Dioscorea cayenensis subsp. rotundata]